MRLTLTVSGLPPGRAFGSHLHKLRCDDPAKAGGHYQNNPSPVGAMANDPAYANDRNEAWLDFTTDQMGAATAETTVDWQPRVGEAKAIVIHHTSTGIGGTAGPKLACLGIPF